MDTNVYIFWGFIAFTVAEASFAGLWYAPFYRTGLQVFKKQYHFPMVVSTNLDSNEWSEPGRANLCPRVRG